MRRARVQYLADHNIMVSYQSSLVQFLRRFSCSFSGRHLVQQSRRLSISTCGLGIMVLSGCAGVNGLSNGLGINSASRVPPPATGSFAIPNSYTNGAAGTGGLSGNTPPSIGPSSPTLGALQTNNIGSGVAYGDQVLSSVNRIQSRIQDTSNQVRDGVVRTTDALNSRVEQASSKVNRIGEGVVQAGAILSESFEEESSMPAPSVSSSGVTQDPNASWRNPTTVK
ncbi:MAG: hypothetical protein ACK5PB_14445 [Pirellula sp.]